LEQEASVLMDQDVRMVCPRAEPNGISDHAFRRRSSNQDMPEPPEIGGGPCEPLLLMHAS